MNQPRPESRISELESQMSIQGARIRELSNDTAENFRDLKQDISHLSDDMAASFKQSAEYQVEQEQKLEARLDKIEATQSEHSERFDKLEVTQSEQGQKLDSMQVQLTQILTLLQQK